MITISAHISNDPKGLTDGILRALRDARGVLDPRDFLAVLDTVGHWCEDEHHAINLGIRDGPAITPSVGLEPPPW